MRIATVKVHPFDATFGATVDGVSLRSMDEATWHAVHDAWVEYGLLIFHDQHLTPTEQDDVARRFGDLEFIATPLTNVKRDGTLRSDPSHDLNKSLLANEGWHHDSTYMPIQAKGAVFSADIIATDGGATGFADMRAAYEALDDATRHEIADLTAAHSRRYSMERAGHHVSTPPQGGQEIYGFGDFETPVRPIVKVHPDTSRPNLVIGQHAHAVSGLSDLDSEALLDRLNDDACIGTRTYHHEWAVGDTVIWDNRRLMHRATPYDLAAPRRMWHTRIAGDAATETALNHR